MSTAELHATLLPLASWLPDLTAERAQSLVGSRAWASARPPPGSLGKRLRAVGGRIVQSAIRHPDGSHGSVNVGLGAGGTLACLCDCADFSAHPPCGHIVGVLGQLAEDPALRAELLRDSSPEHSARPDDSSDGASDGRARAVALEFVRRRGVDLDSARRRSDPVGLLEMSFDSWRRRGIPSQLDDATWVIEIDPANGNLDGPRLRVRVRPSSGKSTFGPDDLESRRLSGREWRLLEPLSSSPVGTSEFVATSEPATIFLDRALESGIVPAPSNGPCVRAILRTTLRPALRLRAAGSAEIAAHPIVAARRSEEREQRRALHDAWKAYTAIYDFIEERRFRELIGLPASTSESLPSPTAACAVEAVWIEAEPNGSAEDSLAPTSVADSIVLRGPTTWVFLPKDGIVARVASDVGPIGLARVVADPIVLLEREDVSRLPPLLHETFQGEGILLPTRDELGLPALPRPHIVLRVSGNAFSAQATLEARYGHTTIALGPDSCADSWDASRDGGAERAALDALRATSLRLIRARRGADPTEPPLFTADAERAVQFWTTDLPRLVAREARGPIDEIVAPSELRRMVVRKPLRSSLEARASGSGLIDLTIAYSAEGIPADLEEIRQTLLAKRRWVRLTDGSIAELGAQVAELALTSQDTVGVSGRVEMPRHALGEAQRWSELADDVRLDPTIRSWRDRLRAIDVAAEPDDVPGLRADLRSYQKRGVAWLQFLTELGVGGILADDMGLGKTVQALALLAWRRARDGQAPSLVVAPTSVATNWIREARRFTPDLECLLLHGSDRHARRHEVPKRDLIVTTYALLRRDIERLRGVTFRYVILDEAQHIKNHTAATTAAARALDAEMRLALTGTPLENRLLELWSIFDFVNPGMLGSWRDFSRRHERPLEEAVREDGEVSGEALAARAEAGLLRARLRPFLLRRTKAEVQKDLPPKIETDVVVELTPAQRRGYAALAAVVREDIGKKISQQGFQKSRMMILTALLRLRQMACDPRLVDSRYRAADSAKLGAFRELVAEVVASGRRALVFSQFVQLLQLLRADLDGHRIAYEYLDGRTRDRDGAIKRFVEGDMPLFLLSLRAGGVGINLAAADVVIHLDPWWNPAVEDQATDRAHRIGQKKTVSVYRLVAAGTIEEAILRMKERKRAIAHAVVGGKDMGLPRGLSEEDVLEMIGFAD